MNAIARDHGQVGSAIAGLRDRRYVGYTHLPYLRFNPNPMQVRKIVTALVLTALMPIQALAATFTDVEAVNENYLAIEYLVSIGTLQGYSDSTFKPAQTINRAELMKVLVAGQGIDPDSSVYQNCFPDVTTDWYAKYVCYAKEQGWVSGYDDNTFKPEQTVNKAEASKMVVGAYGLAPIEGDSSEFNDVTSSDWFIGYIVSLTNIGVIDTDGSIYSPADGMTRGLTAEYIFRVLVSNENDEEIYTTDYRDQFLADAGLSDLLVGVPYIKTVFYDGEVADVESDEYVEVANAGAGEMNLEGYYIMGSKGEEKFTFSSIELDSGESVKVYTNQGDYSFESEDALWSNSGETVYLYDAEGNLVDDFTY